MYQPPHFEIRDQRLLHGLIRSWPLGLLITADADDVSANPLPFILLEDDSGPRLQCHMARANTQWQAIEAGAPVKLVFSGPNHYISPNWYPSKAEHGRAVPTWNYASVQAQGDVSIHHDSSWLRRHTAALSLEQEKHIQDKSQLPPKQRPKPWTLDEAPEPFIEAQLRAIVGLEMKNLQLKGKFKLSQNRSADDRAQVIANLRTLEPMAKNLADLMDHS